MENMNMSVTARRNNNFRPYISILTCVSAVAVVSMHVNNAYWTFREGHAWFLNVFIEKSFNWAVPIFFMISGATLIGYSQRYSHRLYMKKRVQRALIPFISWSIIALVFSLFFVKSVAFGHSLAYYINLVLTNSVPNFTIYWFFPPLFAVYLCIPVLSAVPDQSRINAFCWLIAYSVVIDVARVICSQFGVYFSSALDNPMLGGWLIYPLLGYVLSRIDIKRMWRIVIYLLGAASLLFSYISTIFFSLLNGKITSPWSGGSDLPRVLCACAVFVAFRYGCEKLSVKVILKGAEGRIKKISSLAFGIYLTHKFIIVLLQNAFNINMEKWWIPLLGSPVVFFVSCFSYFYFE